MTFTPCGGLALPGAELLALARGALRDQAAAQFAQEAVTAGRQGVTVGARLHRGRSGTAARSKLRRGDLPSLGFRLTGVAGAGRIGRARGGRGDRSGGRGCRSVSTRAPPGELRRLGGRGALALWPRPPPAGRRESMRRLATHGGSPGNRSEFFHLGFVPAEPGGAGQSRARVYGDTTLDCSACQELFRKIFRRLAASRIFSARP